jgi:radical SAM protein with 4Fe4S-binding SPASM domain
MAAETISEKLDRISRKGYPTNASIEVTARCNARCGYCYLKDCPFEEPSTERLCLAIKKLYESGMFHLHITGGEPFLRPDILTILSFAFDLGIFYCTLFTNGTLLNDEHRSFLVRNRDIFRNIQMSVFSHDRAINDAYFGVPGAFDAILKNALFFKENGLRVSLAMSVLDFNVDTLEETRRFFGDRDLPLVLAYFKTITDPRIEKHVATSTTYSFFKRYLQNLRPDERGTLKLQMKESLESPRQNDAELCYGRWNMVYVNTRGDIAPCLSFRNMALGNIYEERSVHDLLQNAPDYHVICALKKSEMKKCAECKYFNFCTICLGSIHTEKRSFRDVDAQVCDFARALDDIPD